MARDCSTLIQTSHPCCLQVRYSHVINVSALEGKFHVGKKSSAHPHTNMAKAALNMMTLTCAQDFISDHILVNCVDTGWVTDMAPLGVGAKAKTHRTHVVRTRPQTALALCSSNDCPPKKPKSSW